MTRLGFTSKGGSVEEQLERCAVSHFESFESVLSPMGGRIAKGFNQPRNKKYPEYPGIIGNPIYLN